MTAPSRSTWAGTGRQHPPVLLAVGPVLHLDDAVGNKVDAMIGCGLPRDDLDVAAALRRYDREQLLELGFRRDPGLRVVDVALAMRKLDQLADADYDDYHLTPAQTATARYAFADWPRAPDHDRQGERAHSNARQPRVPPPVPDSNPQRPAAPAAPTHRPVQPPVQPPRSGPTPGPRR